MKAAILDGDPDVPNLVAVSYYDQKPVHCLSTICESIHWIQCQKQVYCSETQQLETLKFLRLNVNNDYNHDMGGVDMQINSEIIIVLTTGWGNGSGGGQYFFGHFGCFLSMHTFSTKHT